MDGRGPHTDQLQDPLSWRDQIVMWTLRVYATIGIPASIWFIAVMIGQQLWLIAGVLFTLHASLVAAAFLPGFAPAVRARFLLWFLYLAGTLGVVAIGPHAAGLIMLFAFVVISAIVNGRSGAIQATLISAATLIVLGYLHIGGWVEGVPSRPITTIAPWVTNFILLFVLSSTVAASLTFLVSRIESSLAESREFVARLRERSEERDRAEADLRASEERLRTIVDNASDVIFTLDSLGVITFTSPASVLSVGFAPDELEQRPMEDFVHPDDALLCREALAKILSGEEPRVQISYRIRSKNGTWRCHDTNVSPVLADDGSISYVVGVAKDVTVEKELEEQLRQSQKMEAMGKLAGGVAHDFNNLLTVITGYSDLLVRSAESDSELGEASQAIRDASQRAATLTRQLLAFSRRRTTRPEALDINEVVSEMQQMLDRLVGENVDLELDLDPDVPPIFADTGQIEQVLMNLVVNSNDAIDGHGIIRISTRSMEADELELPTASSDRGVRLSVSDNGCGMDREVMDQIFEPFFTTKEVGSGTGLGLATVYGIVQQVEGSLRVRSELGTGTTFEIDLPGALASTELAEANARPDSAVRQGGTVLLVDDQASVRRVTQRMLEAAGYRVLIATDGVDALDTAAKHEGPIEILLSDERMPRMGGLDLARRMREMDSNITIVLMSGLPEFGGMASAEDLANIQFIDKPFTQDDLLSAITGSD